MNELRRTFLVIDGYNLFIKYYLSNPTMDINGESVGGVVGFLKSLKTLVDRFKPTAAIVAWDGEGSSERRRSIRSDYKEGRKVRLNREYDFGTTPQQDHASMSRQRQLVGEYLEILGVPQASPAGVEADDVIAYLCCQVLEEEANKIVVSNDRDLLQLVGRSNVKVYNHRNDKLLDAAGVVADVGCIPENYSIVKAICGDRGDNVKGVKGVGPKTLLKLCPALGDTPLGLDGVLDTIESMAATGKSKPAKSIVELGRGTIRENMTLVDLSSPVLSASAARAARAACFGSAAFNAAGVRVRAMRDGIQFKENMDVTFRQLTLRRTLWLSSRKEDVLV